MDDNLIWIDCEFTGLDYSMNTLVEIACVVTDSNLNVLGNPVSVVIHHDTQKLDKILEDWSRKHFLKSGLLDEIQNSSVTMRQAENMVLEYVSKWNESGKSPLCGNSVGSDRRVLYKDMPELEKWLHYRNIDISSIKELVRLWKPEILDQIHKQENHRALDDINESIDELSVYRSHLFSDAV